MVGLSLSDAPCPASLIPARFDNSLQSIGSDVDPGVWSAAEVCVGIVGACLPTLRPLFSPRYCFRADRSLQDAHHGHPYGSEESRENMSEQAHITVAAVKPSRFRSGDGRPLIRADTALDTRAC